MNRCKDGNLKRKSIGCRLHGSRKRDKGRKVVPSGTGGVPDKYGWTGGVGRETKGVDEMSGRSRGIVDDCTIWVRTK